MSLSETWFADFLRVIRRPESASPLRDAAMAGGRTGRTRLLTGTVAATCTEPGWRAVSKGQPADFMPAIRRRIHQENLPLDVVAFSHADASQKETCFRWPFPVAVIELENKGPRERMAFSLWKVLTGRAQFRGMFVYARDRDEIPRLVRSLADALLPGFPSQAVADAAPGLLLAVGTRAQAEYFPDGFFHEWVLNPHTSGFPAPLTRNSARGRSITISTQASLAT